MSKLEAKVKALEEWISSAHVNIGKVQDCVDALGQRLGPEDPDRPVRLDQLAKDLDRGLHQLEQRLSVLELRRWPRFEGSSAEHPYATSAEEASSPSRASGSWIDAEELVRRLRVRRDAALEHSGLRYWRDGVDEVIALVEEMVREGQG